MKALWFSGGKDSTACVFLHISEISNIHVLYANTGKVLPEALKTVNRIREMCPLFHDLRVDRDAQWERMGLPSDLVPIDWTKQGQIITNEKGFSVQSYLGCCYDNITAPLWAKTKELGCDVVIRGQRNDEDHRGGARNGTVLEGIRFEHPIESWTKEQVLSYLLEKMGTLPDHFSLDHSSAECYDCTAYAEHSHDRAEYMRVKHASLYADYKQKMTALYGAISEPLRHYERLARA